MSLVIQTNPTAGEIVAQRSAGDKQAEIDGIWWRLFDVVGAVDAVDDHLAALGGDRYEGHTRKAYESSLRYWINWLAGSPLGEADLRKVTVYEFARRYEAVRFPSPGVVQGFIAHQKRKGLKKSTVDRHLAPVRIWLKALRKQVIPATGEVRGVVEDCRHAIMLALEEKVPASESHHGPALYQHGTRLSVAQVSAVFAHLAKQPEDDLKAARDLALLYLGFNAALRDAEIRRLTLNSIREGANSREMVVRGKRNNYAPVPLDEMAYSLIVRWVEMYNARLGDDDPRRITGDVPVFQPLRRGGKLTPLGVNRFKPGRGLGKSSVQLIVETRTAEVLGIKISPHDMRRTAAFIARMHGMDYDHIQALLRHKSIETTRRYVGNPPDLRKSMLSTRVTWGFEVQG